MGRLRTGDAVKARGLRETRGAPRWRLHTSALQRLQSSRVTRTVPEHPTNLGKPDALGGDRHHHAREARFRLAQLERVNPVALGAELVGELA
jgi:hypothetical protein